MKLRVSVVDGQKFLLDIPVTITPKFDVNSYINRFLTSSQVIAWHDSSGYHSRAGKNQFEMYNRHVNIHEEPIVGDAKKRLAQLAIAINLGTLADKMPISTAEYKHYPCSGCGCKVSLTRKYPKHQWITVDSKDQKIGHKVLCGDCRITITQEVTKIPTYLTINCYWNYRLTLQTIC